MISLAEARTRLAAGSRPLVCHARATQRRLGTGAFACFDLLELFAFVHPARFCLPTPRGLAEALDLPIPGSIARQAESLADAAQVLLDGLAVEADADAAAVAAAMAAGGWPWGPAVLAALGAGDDPHARAVRPRLDVWKRIPAWQEDGPCRPRERSRGARGGAGAARAAAWVQRRAAAHPGRVRGACGRRLSSPRPAGSAPLRHRRIGDRCRQDPRLHRAGERLGREERRHRLDLDLHPQPAASVGRRTRRLYPDPEEKAEKVVVRKGRENYLCLLNFEEAVRRRPPLGGADAVASASWPAGRGRAATATWLAATSRHGSPTCSVDPSPST